MNLRPFWVVVHRYAGLAMTVFLVIVGLTGSLLAFYHELDSWLNPAFSAPAGNRPRMGLPSILERVETLAPNARFQSVSLSDDASKSGSRRRPIRWTANLTRWISTSCC